MTGKEVIQIADKVLQKYVPKGGSYKKLHKIMSAENIYYYEVDTKESFVGALTTSDDGRVCLLVNKKINNNGRKNFTIAHELGHYFLKHHLTTNFFYCTDESITEESYNNVNTIEKEANYFATCLLMPEGRIIPAFKSMLYYSKKTSAKDFLDVTIDKNYGAWKGICGDLTKRYGVSETALRLRLATLGLARF